MAKSIQQILGYEAMLGVVNEIKSGVPDVIPPAFLTPKRTVEGNRGQYVKVEGTRQTARAALYGSPSQRREQDGVSTQAVTLIHAFEHHFHLPNVLADIKSTDSPERQQRGEQEIDRQTGLFFRRFGNLRLSAFYSLLTKAAVYFDREGNLLPSSVGAVTTVDFGVPAGNQGQLDWDGNGAIIGASWATDSTDIIGDVTELNKAAVELSGYELRHAFYGENVLNYLLTNTKLKELLNGNASFQEASAAGEIPAGFLGFQWHPAYKAMYQDADGTYQYWFGGDTIVFTPEPSADWFEWLAGTYLVPTSIDVQSSVQSALGALREVPGFFSWCTLSDDPAGVKQLAVDTFLPVLKVPKAIFVADVTP